MQHRQGAQTSVSAPVAAWKKSRNKAPRPQKAERERRKQAWMAATAAAAHGTAELQETIHSHRGDVAAPQRRSDAESSEEVGLGSHIELLVQDVFTHLDTQTLREFAFKHSWHNREIASDIAAKDMCSKIQIKDSISKSCILCFLCCRGGHDGNKGVRR
eukprot:81314-Amphidinium_carterae.1